MRKIVSLVLIFQLVFLSLTVSLQAGTEPTKEQRLAVFDRVWETIRDRYYDPNFNGIDWEEERAKIRPLAAEAADEKELYRLLREMINDLRDSHTRIYAADEKFDWRTPRVLTVGVSVREIEKQLVVVRVEKDSAAEKSGVRIGDKVTSVDGTPAETIFAGKIKEMRGASTIASGRMKAAASVFQGTAGTAAKICWQNQEIIERCAELQREWKNIKPEIRVKREQNVLIVGFDMFSAETIRSFFKVLRDNADSNLRGIVLDFRANRGGEIEAMVDAVSAFLPNEKPIGKFINRKGKTVIDAQTRSSSFFTASIVRVPKTPVVVLTGTATASAAEIFAAAMKNNNRARILGATSCGCVLAVKGQQRLPDGGALEFSELDFQMPNGARIEGAGVAPDEAIQIKLADVRSGRDSALQRALETLKNN